MDKEIRYKVVEIFESINGEGTKAGQLAIFIRFQKCNLRCNYCDTAWAITEDAPFTSMTLDEIYQKVIDSGISNVTLTGGESLLQENIDLLIDKLEETENIYVEIETNGSIDLKKFTELKNRPSFTMDYKLPASTMEKYMNTDNFAYLTKKDTVKFVVSNLNDLEKTKEIINKFFLTDKCSVYISPVFQKIQPSDIVEFMKKNKLNNVNLQIQLHKIIWHPDMKGV